jgi:hypothetical protein
MVHSVKYKITQLSICPQCYDTQVNKIEVSQDANVCFTSCGPIAQFGHKLSQNFSFWVVTRNWIHVHPVAPARRRIRVCEVSHHVYICNKQTNEQKTSFQTFTGYSKKNNPYQRSQLPDGRDGWTDVVSTYGVLFCTQ